MHLCSRKGLCRGCDTTGRILYRLRAAFGAGDHCVCLFEAPLRIGDLHRGIDARDVLRHDVSEAAPDPDILSRQARPEAGVVARAVSAARLVELDRRRAWHGNPFRSARRQATRDGNSSVPDSTATTVNFPVLALAADRSVSR